MSAPTAYEKINFEVDDKPDIVLPAEVIASNPKLQGRIPRDKKYFMQYVHPVLNGRSLANIKCENISDLSDFIDELSYFNLLDA